MMQVQRAISRTAQARPWLRLAVNTCALLAALGAVGVTQADEQRIRAALEPRFNLKFDEVRPLPVGGLWEVVSGMRVFYTDAEASFLLAGTLIDVANERNLTAETAQRLLRVDVGALPDGLARNAGKDAALPASDANRTIKAEWLVVSGVCTHLGCVPTEHEGEFDGWLCHCHGSQYDSSGRVQRGPAPLNLALVPYEFLSDTKIAIGKTA